MVNIPGTSKSCKECKARRIKCGLEQPDCKRCLKRGMKCSGPRVGSIFIHRDVENMQRLSDRTMLSNAIQSQNKSIPIKSKRPTGNTCINDESNKITTTLPMTSSLGCSTDLYRSVIADLWSATYASVIYSPEQSFGSPMSTSSRAILPLAFRNNALDTALFAVSAMYVGKLKKDFKLQDLAIGVYPQAMGSFRSELSSVLGSGASQTSRKIIAVAIALSLLFFEWLAHGTDGDGYRFHLDGALELIKNCGPDALESSVVRVAYIDLRTVALGEALKSRKKTFLASEHWSTITKKLSIKNYRQFLLDIVAHIPSLLERGDQIKLSGGSSDKDAAPQDYLGCLSFQNAQERQIMDYFQDCDSLIRKLRLWLKSVEEEEGGRLWWHSDETLGNEYPQQEHPRSSSYYSPTIQFPNSWIPGILIFYWSGLLELSSTVLEIRRLFVNSTLYAAYFDLLGADSPCMSDLETPSQLAVLVCQTVIHLSSSLEGCTMSHIPAVLAENYFIRLLSDSCQRDMEADIGPSKDYETACMGLDLCMKGQEILRSTLKG